MGDLSSCEYLRRWWISRGFVVSENRVKIGKSENRGNQKIGEFLEIGEIGEFLEIEKIRKSENRKIEKSEKSQKNREIGKFWKSGNLKSGNSWKSGNFWESGKFWKSKTPAHEKKRPRGRSLVIIRTMSKREIPSKSTLVGV